MSSMDRGPSESELYIYSFLLPSMTCEIGRCGQLFVAADEGRSLQIVFCDD